MAKLEKIYYFWVFDLYGECNNQLETKKVILYEATHNKKSQTSESYCVLAF